jgi:hypothetical protein
MNILYKYYSALPKDYILNPTIKLTPPQTLNDPFENIIPSDLLKSIKQDKELRQLTEKYKLEHGQNDQDIINIMRYTLENCGIVSLSETHRNLLMWAHYGAQHKGLCIGYKKDLFNNALPILSEDVRGDIPYSKVPFKIRYDTTRFDPNGAGIIKEKHQSIIHNILLHVLTTKSDEWIYEKEFRYIVPIMWGDCYLSSKMYFDIKNKNKKVDLKEYEFITYDNNNFKVNNLIENTPPKIMSKDQSIIMKRISSDKIDSVYLGCRYSNRDIYDMLKLIENNYDTLGHIKVYKFGESETRFELEAEPIFKRYEKKHTETDIQ